MKRKSLRLAVFILGLAAIAVTSGGVSAQRAERLDTPRQRQAITHIRVGSIEISRSRMSATAATGYLDADSKFVAVDRVSISWQKEDLESLLTQAERDALTSVRKKVRAALAAKYRGAS